MTKVTAILLHSRNKKVLRFLSCFSFKSAFQNEIRKACCFYHCIAMGWHLDKEMGTVTECFYNRWELLFLEIATDVGMLRLARAMVFHL